ncbi:DUF4390 domain-containing protein [Thauera sinica]|uniref:DUF4390 domain-containing protein n=1 Tax=Thauera sinica TaxID=2665146 RepID=A0ABW1AU21_9RHOO|nr:DUF4390 domain-containing protein [Thauera sp. K11]
MRRWLCAVVLMCATFASCAEEALIRSAEIVPGDGGYVLNADIDLELNSRLADAVTRGVSLYFVAELRIERPRWYWLNELVVDRTLDYRLHYNAITRSYRLSIGSFQQSFDSLDAAVRTMLRIRNWQVAGSDELRPGVSHQVALRFQLDTSQLPKPFQVTAIGSRDWDLGTEWVRWTFLPGAAASR